jgi:hypothetical protein
MRRRLERAREHLLREQARAQRHLRALAQALVDLGLPETVAAELEWRLKTLGKLLGKIFGLMFPTLFGCQTTAELSRVRCWDKNLPRKLLGALPKRQCVRRLQRVGQALLAHVAIHHRGTMLVAGQRPYVFHLRDGRRVTGRELVSRADWPWRESPQVPRVR